MLALCCILLYRWHTGDLEGCSCYHREDYCAFVSQWLPRGNQSNHSVQYFISVSRLITRTLLFSV